MTFEPCAAALLVFGPCRSNDRHAAALAKETDEMSGWVARQKGLIFETSFEREFLARDVAGFLRVCPSVPKRPYRWQRPTLGQRLLRIGLSGWLWLTAAILAVVLIVLYLA